jgi:SAM-dependent methyltransferase
MKTVRSHYLDNGLGFNHGQAATLIEIEDDTDYDKLLDHIVESDFYGRAYLPRQSGQTDDRLTAHFWWVAEIVAALAPRRVIELGCGRGDVLRILQQEHGVDVSGIDMGSALHSFLWPSLKEGFRGGSVLDVLRNWDDAPYDVACGFDIWEHFLPQSLDEIIERMIEHSTDDALFVFVIPAFGQDAVFGEQFPLEFEENRDAFERREPFRFLLTDPVDEHVPAAGHLTWAHTDWWVDKFTAHGLVREPEIERRLHPAVDAHVPHSIKSFYIFRRAEPAARARAAQLTQRLPAPLVSLRALERRRRFERRTGAEFTVALSVEARRWVAAHAPVVARGLRRARRNARRALGRPA